MIYHFNIFTKWFCSQWTDLAYSIALLFPSFPFFTTTTTRDGLIVPRNYRMPIYRDFQYIEEYIVSNLQYRVSRYSQNQWFFCLFSPKILWKFRKFPENSENPWTKVFNNNNNNNADNSKNSPKILKIRRKFLKKKVFFEALISYRYRIISRKNPNIVSSRKKAYRPRVTTTTPTF